MLKLLINQILKMKKHILLLFVILGSFSEIKAQEDESRAEKIEALKIAFITQKLQLTSDEAQKFWPVYNQYENEIRSLQLDNRNGPALENEEKLLGIRKKYKTPF